MMLDEYKKKRKGKKLLKFVGAIVVIIATIATLHACGVRLLHGKFDDFKNFSNEFKENAKEFAPTKEEAKEFTKTGIEKFFDFFMKGSKYIDENITQPAFELSNELAMEQTQRIKEKHEESSSPSSESLVHVAFWYAIDGDTLQVLTDDSEFITVRLIGINTPESVAKEEYLEQKGTENSEYGEKASEWVSSYIERTIVTNHSDLWLQYDVETKDQYGRTLAYVWISDEVDVESEADVIDYMLNAQIVKNGYAEDVVYEPNHKYAHIFKKLREEAEKSKIGLWQYDNIGDYY